MKMALMVWGQERRGEGTAVHGDGGGGDCCYMTRGDRGGGTSCRCVTRRERAGGR